MNLGNCCRAVVCQKGTWKVSSATVVLLWLGIFPSSQPIGPGQPHLAGGSIQCWVYLSSGSAVWAAALQQGSCSKWSSAIGPVREAEDGCNSMFGHISTAVTQTWLKYPVNPHFDSQKCCSSKHLRQLLFWWQKWELCSFIWPSQPVLT